MTRSAISLLLVCAVLAGLTLAGLSCSKQQPVQTPVEPAKAPTPAEPAAGEAVKVGILTNEMAPFWNPMEVGMNRAAANPAAMAVLGGGVEMPETVEEVFTKITGLLKAEKEAKGGLPPCEAFWKAPQQGTLDEQRRLLDEFRASGVDGISISPRESEPLAPVLDGLVDAGILVVCMDSDAPTSKRLAYIGTNNFEAGKIAGEAAAKVFGSEGTKLIGFVGDKGSENAKERIGGFREVAKQHKIDLFDVREDDGDKGRARQNAEDVIQAMPDVNGFLGIWSYDAPAITQAVLDAKKQDKIKIVSFDAEPQTLIHLQKGEIEATIVQKPYLFGYLSVQLIYAMKVLGVEQLKAVLPADGVLDTGVTVVTPENVGEFMKYLDSLGVESS